MRSRNDAFLPWPKRAFGLRTTKTWTPGRSLRRRVGGRVSPEARPDTAGNYSFAAPLTLKCRANSPQWEFRAPKKSNLSIKRIKIAMYFIVKTLYPYESTKGKVCSTIRNI